MIAIFAGLSVFAGTAMFVWIVLPSAVDKRPRRMPRALRAAKRREPVAGYGAKRREGGLTELVRRHAGRVPLRAGTRERLEAQLESAGWPVKPGELLSIQALLFAGGVLLAAVLLGRPLFGIALGSVAAGAPRLVLAQRMRSRKRAFVAQLPQVLQLLAGSLRAGYGLPQALDTVSREAHPPSSIEFARAIAEARLGLPIDQALAAVADRTASEDFRWVVMAIEIQRQVGGRLGDLLETAAATLREREQIRRQVKVLSAEGRLSAYILGLLPFALAVYLSLMNPQSLVLLASTPPGRAMVIVALALMAMGAAWMRRIVRIKV